MDHGTAVVSVSCAATSRAPNHEKLYFRILAARTRRRVPGHRDQLAPSAVALAVSGGISALVLDDQEFASIGGEARLSSGSALGDTPRYAVEIGGGASALQIVPRAAP
jgi:hypothetical protein